MINDIINNGSSTNAEDMMDFNPFNGMDKRIVTGDEDFQEDNLDEKVNTHKLTTFTLASSKGSSIKVGGETRITLVASVDSEKNIFSVPRCVYESSDLSVASVDNDGIVYAKKAGSVTITVTNADDIQYYSTIAITVIN